MNSDSTTTSIDKKTSSQGAGLAAVLGFFAFLKPVLPFILKTGTAIKFAGIITTCGTMLISLYAWALFFGWEFAGLLVLTLLVHESGHWIWMKLCKLNPRLPIFIPLVGAFVQMRRLPSDEATSAWVAFAGPLVGGLASALLLLCGTIYDSGALLSAAVVGFFINLFQMIPAKPFDGGFIAVVISRWILIPGSLILFLIGVYIQSPILAVIGVLSMLSNFGPRPRIASATYTGTSKTLGELEDEIEKEYEQRMQERLQFIKEAGEVSASVTKRLKSKVVKGAATRKQRISIAVAYLLLLYGLAAGLDLTFQKTGVNLDCVRSSSKMLEKYNNGFIHMR